jgi:hypothetical protein
LGRGGRRFESGQPDKRGLWEIDGGPSPKAPEGASNLPLLAWCLGLTVVGYVGVAQAVRPARRTLIDYKLQRRLVAAAGRAIPPLSWEPVSGFEALAPT